jgi:bacterial/archaeal transporter family-2 protein
VVTFSTALLLGCSLLIGACGASQAGLNARLRLALHSPIQAAFISFLIGTLLLGTLALMLGDPWSTHAALAALPWWAWLGGLLGAFNVAMSVYLAPRLGALALAISILCGQVLVSMLLDHNGWLGYPRIELTGQRLLGAVFIVAGVCLVAMRRSAR